MEGDFMENNSKSEENINEVDSQLEAAEKMTSQVEAIDKNEQAPENLLEISDTTKAMIEFTTTLKKVNKGVYNLISDIEELKDSNQLVHEEYTAISERVEKVIKIVAQQAEITSKLSNSIIETLAEVKRLNGKVNTNAEDCREASRKIKASADRIDDLDGEMSSVHFKVNALETTRKNDYKEFKEFRDETESKAKEVDERLSFLDKIKRAFKQD